MNPTRPGLAQLGIDPALGRADLGPRAEANTGRLRAAGQSEHGPIAGRLRAVYTRADDAPAPHETAGENNHCHSSLQRSRTKSIVPGF